MLESTQDETIERQAARGCESESKGHQKTPKSWHAFSTKSKSGALCKIGLLMKVKTEKRPHKPSRMNRLARWLMVGGIDMFHDSMADKGTRSKRVWLV